MRLHVERRFRDSGGTQFDGETVRCLDCYAEAPIRQWNRRELAPDGWKLVPIEPTVAMAMAYKGALKEMIEALPMPERAKRHAIREPFKMLGRWRAMLNAAPKATP